METLENLLKHKKHIWFCLNNNNKKEFLKFAKQNGCVWMNGDEINIEKDNVGFYMGINKFKQLGFITHTCWMLGSKKIKFNFDELI